ncbi:LamG-like jellyroll fold domain-containing protein [Planctomycetota bacterium]
MCRRMICLASLALVLGLILTSTAQAENIAWWKFDEGSGSTAYDSSGNDHHAEVLGTPEWGDGPSGFSGALDFTATGGARCNDFDPTGGTGVFTLTLWCLWDGTSGTQHFLTKSNAWGADTMMFQVEVKAGDSNPDRTDRMALAYQGSTQAILHVVPKNEWAHMALVFDGTNATGYVNGVDEAGPQPTGIGAYVDAPVLIGVTWNGSRVFQGLLDDMRLFDRVLTESEIMSIMAGDTGQSQTAYGPDPADEALLTNTWVNLSWRPGPSAVSHDVYLGDNFDDVSNGTGDTSRGNQSATTLIVGFPGFPYPDGLEPGTTYFWRIDEVNDADPNSPWKGPVWSFSIAPKTAYNPDPPDGAEFVDPGVTLSWTGGFGAKLHTVYFGDNFDEVNDSTTGAPRGNTTYNPGLLEVEKVYYWRVDEFDGAATYKGDVWSFTTPGAVGNPQPAYGADNVQLNVILSWTPADSAASHQLYFGMGKEAVRTADAGSPEYKGSKALGAESYDPGLLDADTAYYWRVDEVDSQGNTSTGPIWIFTTGGFLLVEDFESYTDDDAAGEAIWQTWIDGFGIADNGAQVGYLMPPYAEQTIVHNGSQSMPILYVNEAGVTNSEASLSLTTPRDWTQAGVSELSLWFRGGSINAAEPLYAAVSNSAGDPAVVAYDDASAAQISRWTQWVIPLQAFADQGINLSNVAKIAIGLGSKAGMAAPGGSGTMYIDDIRLY